MFNCELLSLYIIKLLDTVLFEKHDFYEVLLDFSCWMSIKSLTRGDMRTRSISLLDRVPSPANQLSEQKLTSCNPYS